MFPIWLSDWYISGLICLFKTDNNSFPHHSNPWIQRCLFLILMLQLNLLVVCRYLLQLNIHLSLNPPLIVCRYPLQLNIHPSPFHWFVAYFCFSFRHSILGLWPSISSHRLYELEELFTPGQIHVGASGRWQFWELFTSGRIHFGHVLLASLALSGLRPSACRRWASRLYYKLYPASWIAGVSKNPIAPSFIVDLRIKWCNNLFSVAVPLTYGFWWVP